MTKNDTLLFYNLSEFPELTYGISTREHGTMKPGDSASSRAHTKERREQYFLQQGIFPHQVVAADLAHGTEITLVGEAEGGTAVPKTDALLTAQKHLYLSVTVADCFPVFLYDPEHQALGLIHAGWRGVIADIITTAIHRMEQLWGTDPAHLAVAIGPGIQSCHFEFPIGALNVFQGYEHHVGRNEKGVVTVDIPSVIAAQAAALGVRNIETCGVCTYCNPSTYFSYRRDKPEFVQAMAVYFGKQ